MSSRTPEQLVADLQAAGVAFTQLQHGPVMTVEAQVGAASVCMTHAAVQHFVHAMP
jgi:hypothetical protein